MSDSPSLEQIYGHACRLVNAEERNAFLDRVCGTDVVLRRKIEALLANHDDSVGAATGFIGCQPTLGNSVSTGEQPSDHVEDYVLRERLGEGGYGTVFAADQLRPVQRPVALKILKPGLDTRQVVARFERERQTLARLQHPHIARVYDGGSTSSGRPYFVMERVNGSPITPFADARQLSLEQRLQLFVLVCYAVHHAHQKGVIHRDLKPANILVEDGPEGITPKIIDFGVAKAVNPTWEAPAQLTGEAQCPGTPAYMSPEQAGWNNLDVDIRADVYALGAVLHEMLVGLPAVPPEESRNLEQLRRRWSEVTWLRPSVRYLACPPEQAKTIAHQRACRPRDLVREVRQDLDWVVLRAMEVDRDRRYDTAASLARDLERFLTHEPVEACPPSWKYRAAKFVRRRRGWVVAVLTVGIAVSLGVALAGWGMRRAQEEARLARTEADKVRGLMDVMFRALVHAEPTQAGRHGVTVREMLEDLARAADAGELEPAAVEASVRDLLSFVHHESGEFEAALRHAERGLELTTGQGGDPTMEAGFRTRLGEVYKNLGDGTKAQEQLEKALQLRRRLHGPHHEESLRVALLAARMQQLNGDSSQALALAQEALAASRQLTPPSADQAPLIRALHMVGLMLRSADRLAEAEALVNERWILARDRRGPDHPEALHALADLGLILLDQGRFNEAEAALTNALAGQQQRLGSDYPQTVETLVGLAGVRAAQGDTSGSVALYREALGRATHTGPNDQLHQRPWIREAIAALQQMSRPPDSHRSDPVQDVATESSGQH